MDDILTKNKKDKFDTYWIIIFFLNEKMFFNLIGNHVINKKCKYPQYRIQLPTFSFALQNLCEKMKELNNILIILAKTETSKQIKDSNISMLFDINMNYLIKLIMC